MTDGVPRSEFLIRGATVVTMDPAIGDLTPGDIHVGNGEILAVAPEVQVDAGTEIVEAAGMIVLPGLIDTHWHLWNSTFRGLIGFEAERVNPFARR